MSTLFQNKPLTFSNSKFDLGQLSLICLLITILVLLFFPLPSAWLDFFLACNLMGSLTLLLISISISNALKLFSFPSIILITTLFRLALSINSTRSILSHAKAGMMIESFGRFMTAGNPFIGLLIFAVIQIVQFIIIAKGSERIAEVSARFTLDALPGKQMSIDSDLRAGMITSEEAKFKRESLLKESKFYGAMDGAMKFVKGEAIASFLITFVNILFGIGVGYLSQGYDIYESIAIYTRLSIGEGLVSQIPAFLIALTAGFLITRVNDTQETHSSLGDEICKQLSHHRSLFTSALLTLFLSTVPGFPIWQMILISVTFTSVGLLIFYQNKKRQEKANSLEIIQLDHSQIDYKTGCVEALVLEVHPETYDNMQNHPIWQNSFFHMYPEIKRRLTQSMGVPFPDLKITQNTQLNPNHYQILIYQIPVFRGYISANHVLLKDKNKLQQEILCQTKTDHTVQGSEVYLLPRQLSRQHESMQNSYIHPEKEILKNIARLLKKNAQEFIGIQEVKHILQNLEKDYSELVRECVPRLISLAKFTEILKRLVHENVPISNVRLILEILLSEQPDKKDIVTLTETVRIGLKRVLTYQYAQGKNNIKVFLIDPELEEKIQKCVHHENYETFLTLPPEDISQIQNCVLQSYQKHCLQYHDAILLTSIEVRRYLKKIIESEAPEIAVLSYQELESHIQIHQLDTISLYPPEADEIQSFETASQSINTSTGFCAKAHESVLHS